MQSFKQFLNEESGKFAPWHIRDHDKLVDFLANQLFTFRKDKEQELNNEGYWIDKDGSVNYRVGDTLHILNKDLIEIPGGHGLPFKYSHVNVGPSSLYLTSDQITNLWGMPNTVNSTLEMECKNLKTLAHLNCKISDTFIVDCESLETFDCDTSTRFLRIMDIGANTGWKNFYRFFKVEKALAIYSKAILHQTNKGLLGLCNLDGNPKIWLYDTYNSELGQSLEKSLDIINNSNRDIMDCREELVQAGFKEYAKL